MRRLFLRILNKLGILRLLNFSVQVKLNQTSFAIPIHQSVGIENMFLPDPWMIQLLEKIIPVSKGRFIDVGVNIGQTLLKVKSISPDLEYLGFEPNLTCNAYLTKLVKANRFERVTILPVGLSTKSGIGKLYLTTNSVTDSAGSVIEGFRPDHIVKSSQFISLYDLKAVQAVEPIDSIGILKIDVEGAELEVLKTMETLIAQTQPIILVEILPVYTSENSKRVSRQTEIEVMMERLGYAMHRVLKNKGELAGLEKISTIGVHADVERCEYVMVPKTKKLQEFTF